MGVDRSDLSSSKSFLRSKEELELKLEKARVEAKVVELKLRALELDRMLTLCRRDKKGRRTLTEDNRLNDGSWLAVHQVQASARAIPESLASGPPVHGIGPPRDDAAAVPHKKVGNAPPERSVGDSFTHANLATPIAVPLSAKPEACVPSQTQRESDNERPTGRQSKRPRRHERRHAQLSRQAVAKATPSAAGSPAIKSVRPAAGAPATTSLGQARRKKSTRRESSAVSGKVVRPWFRSMPSWMISTLVHCIVILVMALLVFPLQMKREDIFITGNSRMTESEPLKEVEFQSESLEEMQELETEPVELANMGLANLGEVSAVAEPSESGEVGCAPVATIATDIGTLFGRGGEGLADAGAGQGGAQFFTVTAGGNRFAFVVDRSASMRTGGGYKWQAALAELLAAVGRMEAQQSFFVIFFSGDPYPMFDKKNPERRTVLATKENLENLENWLETVQPNEKSARTKLETALEYVLQMKPDATFILSDGKLTSTKPESFLQEANKPSFDPLVGEIRPSVIHSITFGEKEDEGGVLQRIAEANGGSYSHHTPPKAPKPARGGAS